MSKKRYNKMEDPAISFQSFCTLHTLFYSVDSQGGYDFEHERMYVE